MKKRFLHPTIIGMLFLIPAISVVGLPVTQDSSLEALIRQLSASSAVDRARAANEIAGLGREAEPAIPALIKLLADETPLEWRREGAVLLGPAKFADTSPASEAAMALAAIGSVAIEPLLTAIDSSRAKVRRNACDALVQLLSKAGQEDSAPIDPRIADVMLRLLDDSDWHVRSTAAEFQMLLRDPRAFEALLRMATNRKENEYVRSSALEALNSTNDSRAVDALVAMLSDASPGVQWSAVSHVSRRNDPRFVEPLIRMLSRPEPESHALHLVAVEALAGIGDRRALEPLIQVLERFVSETRKSESFTSTADDTATAAHKALMRIAEGDFGGPACKGSDPIVKCHESRAAHWRAWFEAQRIKKQ